ncbi:hypothetical protein [Bythopirellula goksoeyrii]|uniref:Uncharacterized protein n=1 Tax=Bythopirellula goksoeyrii TaxID=1400387 RepID=A0A5B9QU35_9BACT|nr:hypothetical protein [Bythopirellula goksoeyrii]QEG37581.1 hypothetical protein Pr1d_49270 [Bythopirellula goksoeyrii]
MSKEKPLEDPINRVVSVFDEPMQAEAAVKLLLEDGFSKEQLRVFHGPEDAAKVDTSKKWFADTDVDIKRYRRELEVGNTVISVPIEDGESRNRVHALLKNEGARLTTHFGEWITEVLQ